MWASFCHISIGTTDNVATEVTIEYAVEGEHALALVTTVKAPECRGRIHNASILLDDGLHSFARATEGGAVGYASLLPNSLIVVTILSVDILEAPALRLIRPASVAGTSGVGS